MIGQLPLSIGLRDDATFESYFPGDNAQAICSILRMFEDRGEPFIYIWGSSGVGLTHLLQASCHAAPEYQKTAVYIPFDREKLFAPTVFQGLENINLVCLDDIHRAAGNPTWEESLFHLFNRLQPNGNRLLVAADCPPSAMNVKMPDLKSRLSSGVVYQIKPLSDDQKLAAIQLRAHCRGLELEKAVGSFLLRRCSRTLPELFKMLDTLDCASLTEQRRLTIPFVKQVLGV